MAVCCECLLVRRGERGVRVKGRGRSCHVAFTTSRSQAQGKECPTTDSVLPVGVCVRKRCVVWLTVIWCMQKKAH